ncbi:unnamed protein product [Penicillium salamii]|uniref:BD-FAE-like domain-containing protein n=1 Tax=Penicillium salamii TaxID=1612424 RepID=A0A9W4NJA1_9EURO|nr:unnamed protein product [Penicillium salamii]CAG8094526.1 unnamed protein product [Penicillium salamii]CAG8096887.1 unnamed protein product [Penicillium salamii]CAG8140064.1 unnamed protein product [Penicillium salamii]CAG8192642.1 unnamed protein product [Penicillium salamii]
MAMDTTKKSEVSGQTAAADLDPIAIAARGNEILGLDIFRKTDEDISVPRVMTLLSEMNADKPTGGTDMVYGDKESQNLRFWKPDTSKPPVILFVHGGSWRSGTNLDSIGSVKVNHLVSRGYAFASVNYSLVPSVTVEEQVQEVADSVSSLVQNANALGIDPDRIILMGHSSGAHVVTLLGTDPSYLANVNVSIGTVRAVISLDGSNYNALAEITDSPGPVAENLTSALGTDPKRLVAMSPTHHACGPNAGAFLLLHVQRSGDIRQAVELSLALKASGTTVDLHVFEGEFFEGHVQLLLRLGNPEYPATLVLDDWLELHVPITPH